MESINGERKIEDMIKTIALSEAVSSIGWSGRGMSGMREWLRLETLLKNIITSYT